MNLLATLIISFAILTSGTSCPSGACAMEFLAKKSQTNESNSVPCHTSKNDRKKPDCLTMTVNDCAGISIAILDEPPLEVKKAKVSSNKLDLLVNPEFNHFISPTDEIRGPPDIRYTASINKTPQYLLTQRLRV